MKKYSRAFLTGLYKKMLKIRLCEESFIEPIINKEIICPVHLYSGQEAVAVGVCANLKKDDYVFGTHRSHGHYLAKGGSMKRLVAEVYGKETGCSKGRGGSMHLCDPERGFLGAAPIVAGTISLALGSALVFKIKKKKNVTVSFFGDGATGEGVFYESLNLASLKKLPILFACENNFYSTHMPIKECRPENAIYKVGEPFCIPSFLVDGNDVLRVFEAAKKAIAWIRAGKGPVLLEFRTYRLRGHVGPDDNIQGSRVDIRPQEEIKRWKLKDPIRRFELFLLKNRIAKPEYLVGLRRLLEKEISEAHLFAKQSSAPDRKGLSHYVFK